MIDNASWYLVWIEGGPIRAPASLSANEDADRPINSVGFFATRKALSVSEQESISLAIDDTLDELRAKKLVPDDAGSELPQISAVKVWKPIWL